MNVYKRQHKMLKFLFDFYRKKYDSTKSREFPPEDYRVPISEFNESMRILNYHDEAVLNPLLKAGEIIGSNDGKVTYYHIPEAGRSAYLNKKYLNELARHRQEWPKRNWIIIAAISFLAGSIFSPLVVRYIEREYLPESTQINIPTQPFKDTSSQN